MSSAPQALYTDWKNVYVRSATQKEVGEGKVPVTQLGRMCAKLTTPAHAFYERLRPAQTDLDNIFEDVDR